MKYRIIYCPMFIGALFCQHMLLAQGENNIWYFGRNAGLDFSTQPPTVLTDGEIVTTEGTVSVADTNGNLLFYSNGEKLWNRNHEVMKNGDSLLGSYSTTQSVVAVRIPLSDHLYYVFTTDRQPALKGVNYSILDMDLDGGKGAIPVVKNKFLLAQTSEKLTTVMHANGRDVWLLTTKYHTDEVYAYLITPSGLDTNPVISKTGNVITDFPKYPGSRGEMKISPDGKRLAMAHLTIGVQLANFNDVTGKVTNSFLLRDAVSAYGVEFSPSGRYLYVSEQENNIRLLQYDLSASNILATRTLLSIPYKWWYGALQLAPDHKIYVAAAGSDTISVVEKPDMPGTQCGFIRQYIWLKTGANSLGLPSFNSAIFFKPTFEFQNICLHDTTHFSTYAPSADSVRWDFGDPQSGALNFSSLTEADHLYSLPGIYTVTMLFYRRGQILETVKEVEIVSTEVDLGRDTTLCNDENLELNGTLAGANYLWQDSTTLATYQVSAPGTYWLETELKGCKSRDSIRIDYNNVAVELGNDTTLCENETLLLKATTPGASYLWQDSTSGSAYLVKGPGMYSVEIAKGRCKASDSIDVQYRPLPNVDLGKDTVMCNGHTLTLNASTGNAQYLWQDGSTTASIHVRYSGSYAVRVSDGCVAYDTILVDFQHCDCDFYFPTAFSPNGDGFNDVYKAISDCAIYYYSLRIFTRWGEEVFATDQIDEAWDGKYNGEDLPRGVYIYLLQQRSYNYPLGEVCSGSLSLLR